MKNLIFFFVLLSFTAKGQDSETTNKFILGGSITGFISSNVSPEQETINSGTTLTSSRRSSSNYSIGISPYLGFQLNKRSLIGIQATAGFSGFTSRFSDNNEITSRTKRTVLGTGLFYRFYLNPNNKFKLFIQPASNVRIQNTTREDFAPAFEEQRTFEFDAGVGLGATYQISEKWNLLVNIWNIRYNYNNFRSGGQDESTISTFVSAGFSLRNISFGAEYLF
jgi:hypothetical protein